MLAHLRQRIITVLASSHTATLATTGPAGLQARMIPCESREVFLYLLLPGTSDQLLNLEHDPKVIVTTAEWQLQGNGRILQADAAPPHLGLVHSPGAQGCVIVEVHPLRLHINRRNGWGFSETIDCNMVEASPGTT